MTDYFYNIENKLYSVHCTQFSLSPDLKYVLYIQVYLIHDYLQS